MDNYNSEAVKLAKLARKVKFNEKDVYKANKLLDDSFSQIILGH